VKTVTATYFHVTHESLSTSIPPPTCLVAVVFNRSFRRPKNKNKKILEIIFYKKMSSNDDICVIKMRKTVRLFKKKKKKKKRRVGSGSWRP